MDEVKASCLSASAGLTRRRFVQGVASAASLTLANSLGGVEPDRGLPATSWWPEWRHDGHRSGSTGLAGVIKKPAEHWRYFLGAPSIARVDDQTKKPPVDVHDLDGSGRAYRVQVIGNVFSVLDAKGGSPVWRYEMKNRKDGYLAPVVANFAPANAGLEVVVWPVNGNAFGDSKDLAYCFSFAGGVKEGRLLWTIEPPVGKVYTPVLMAAGASKGNGHDLVVLAWHGVTVWNGTTGRLAQHVEWPAVRPYGLSTCVRFPAAGPLRVVNIADYVPHIHVAELGEGPGGSKLLWGRHYAKTNELSTLMLRVHPHSVIDLDNDGTTELVFNLYNEKHDHKWHLIVLDIGTGRILLDVPDCFVWGIEDIDRDGRPELLCARVPHADPSSLGELTVRRFIDSKLKTLWSLSNARFLLEDVKAVPLETVTGSRATVLRADVDGDGAREFLVERDTDGDALPDRFEGYAFGSKGKVALKWHYQAQRERPVNARAIIPAGQGGQLQFCDLSSGDLVTVDSKGNEATREKGVIRGFATVPVAADVDSDGRCEIAVVNSRREVELLAAPRAGRKETVTRLWKKRGQGMVLYQGYTPPNLTLGLADVDGDGVVETLFSGETKEGLATLAAARPDGRVLWEKAFADVGTDGIYSGVTRWFTGRFLGHKGHDVGVVFHAVGNGSNQLAVLDGRTGQVAWGGVATIALPGGSRAYVGNRPLQAVHDFDADGKDDIAFHDVYFNVILSGATGKLLNGRGVVDIYGTTLNYAYLMLADVDGDGNMDLVLHGPTMHTMAQTADMKKRWFRDWKLKANHFPPAITMIDGRSVLGMPGEDGVFRCVCAADGTILWEEPIGHPGASSVGAADVDGDGVPDFFYVDKSGELVVVRGKAGREQKHLLWTYPVGAAQDPIFADIDGDGRGEFLLVTDDGNLRCIGPA